MRAIPIRRFAFGPMMPEGIVVRLQARTGTRGRGNAGIARGHVAACAGCRWRGAARGLQVCRRAGRPSLPVDAVRCRRHASALGHSAGVGPHRTAATHARTIDTAGAPEFVRIGEWRSYAALLRRPQTGGSPRAMSGRARRPRVVAGAPGHEAALRGSAAPQRSRVGCLQSPVRPMNRLHCGRAGRAGPTQTVPLL